MKNKIKIPFKKRFDCDIYDQVSWCYLNDESIDHRDNYIFDAKLKYNGFNSRRSSLNIEWECVKTGVRYQSSMKLLDEVLKSDCINIMRTSMFKNGEKSTINLTIQGKFTFKKQGTAFLLTNSID